MKTIFTTLILVVATLFMPITNLCAQEEEDAGGGYIIAEKNGEAVPTGLTEKETNLDPEELAESLLALREVMGKYYILAASSNPSDMEMAAAIKQRLNQYILASPTMKKRLAGMIELQNEKIRELELADRVHPFYTAVVADREIDLSHVVVILNQHEIIICEHQKNLSKIPPYYRKTKVPLMAAEALPYDLNSVEKDSIPIKVVPESNEKPIIYTLDSAQTIRKFTTEMDRQILNLHAGAGQAQIRTL